METLVIVFLQHILHHWHKHKSLMCIKYARKSYFLSFSYLKHISICPAAYAVYQLIVIERIRVRYSDRVHSSAAFDSFSHGIKSRADDTHPSATDHHFLHIRVTSALEWTWQRWHKRISLTAIGAFTQDAFEESNRMAQNARVSRRVLFKFNCLICQEVNATTQH